MDESSVARRSEFSGLGPRQRFSSRVRDYVLYRPGYPAEILSLLRASAGLSPESIVADVGSGTGISSKLFLDHGNTVYGVEPNADMRQAAEGFLTDYPQFKSVNGAAEATTLATASIDLVVAGQAYHWFDPGAARAEFQRILRTSGRVVLMWNRRKTTGTPFLQAYEQLLLDHSLDYQAVRHENIGATALHAFFGPAGFQQAVFPNQQSFDLGGLRGRLLSSSYAPGPGQPKHDAMMNALERLFNRFNTAGRVQFDYDTQVYIGSLHA